MAGSRRRRKHGSGLPRHASWWIAVLFSVGSVCFLVGPMPWYVALVGGQADGATFFVGSLLFTGAAALQWLEAVNSPAPRRVRLLSWEPHRIDWWSTGVQLLGTLAFNATTWRALDTAVHSPAYDRAVWRPDAYGSVCFLIAGYLAYVEVARRPLGRPPRTLEGGIVTVNLLGCVAFGAAAVASYVLPVTGAVLDQGLADLATSIGAAAFLVGAVLLVPEARRDIAEA